MKLIAILFLLLIVQCSYCNEIDNLQTKADVQVLLAREMGKNWKGIDFFKLDDGDTSEYSKNGFLKLDLDNNGTTDLLVTGKYFFALVGDRFQQYKTYYVGSSAYGRQLSRIIYKDRIPLLITVRPEDSFKARGREITDTVLLIEDTLILRPYGFMEYNPYPDKLDIDAINFRAGPCYGTCPIFSLIIKKNREISFDATEHNDRTGKFSAMLDSSSYEGLIETINYVKLNTLEDKYRVLWTDDQTVYLEIALHNGQTKKISDYGARGTIGLKALYNQLFELRSTQKWK